ncbi:hypothetical protein EIN_176390 [Entamoeba invadens IP1]|uniref:hypothetical protein n=1 Tax=Entamoeba invadens IP1 TaxID=370355 RepID=UPI0002C3D931|nr:hypothetical protein EIN_176390 [Entamoeba invadens IP1]ELP93822.1 hypothetical protein EIN_176390 [Entamoeba invadens IP1]|eukprot:XP_004260593.1 hypothetical protein EIN_176390 [Entamoeba invadens IP1]
MSNREEDNKKEENSFLRDLGMGDTDPYISSASAYGMTDAYMDPYSMNQMVPQYPQTSLPQQFVQPTTQSAIPAQQVSVQPSVIQQPEVQQPNETPQNNTIQDIPSAPNAPIVPTPMEVHQPTVPQQVTPSEQVTQQQPIVPMEEILPVPQEQSQPTQITEQTPQKQVEVQTMMEEVPINKDTIVEQEDANEKMSEDDDEYNEEDAKKFYCEEKPLHKLPHPLQILEQRRPGKDVRKELKNPNGMIELFSNVVFVANLPENTTEQSITTLLGTKYPLKRIKLFADKHHCFITFYTRTTAMEAFRFFATTETAKGVYYKVSWGREYCMKGQLFDEKYGRCTLNADNIPDDIIVCFDHSYVMAEDLQLVYGKICPQAYLLKLADEERHREKVVDNKKDFREGYDPRNQQRDSRDQKRRDYRG